MPVGLGICFRIGYFDDFVTFMVVDSSQECLLVLFCCVASDSFDSGHCVIIGFCWVWCGCLICNC